MFRPTYSKIDEYYKKSLWIKDSIEELIQEGKYSPLDEEIIRIKRTNKNNLDALQYAVQTSILPGRTVFWLIKKTVDMNHDSISRMFKNR